MKKLIVLFAALVMAFMALPAFAGSSMEADWSFYGQARMWTAWESIDSNTPAILTGTGTTPFRGQYGYQGYANAQRWQDAAGQFHSDAGLGWELQGNSRIGAIVKWGNVGGQFELGMNPVGLRLMYGTWNFGAGILTVGQDYTPSFSPVTNMCGPGGGECNGIGFGTWYTGRQPQLKLTFGGFQIALVRPYTTNMLLNLNAAVIAGGTPNPDALFVAPANLKDKDQFIPDIEAAYRFNLGPAALEVGGWYGSTRYVTSTVAEIEKKITIDSWGFNATAKTAFGPFYLNGALVYAQNPNDYQQYTDMLPTFALVDALGDNKENASYFAAQLVPGFRIMDSLAIEGGVFYQYGKVKGPATDLTVKENVWVYYLQLNWSPVKNVFIVPELGMIDYGKLKTEGGDLDVGNTKWLGIKWQINF